MKVSRTNLQHLFIIFSFIYFCIAANAQPELPPQSYFLEIDENFPGECGITSSYDCVDVVLESKENCAPFICGGGYLAETEQYNFSGTLSFTVKEPNNISSIEVVGSNDCAGSCTSFRVFSTDGTMVHEVFTGEVPYFSPYVNSNNIPIGSFQFSSCVGAFYFLIIEYLDTVSCSEPDPNPDPDPDPDPNPDSPAEQTLTYTIEDFPPFCDETINHNCVDITFETGCGCWGDAYPGAAQYLFGGTMNFNINVSYNISSIEVEQNDYCGGTCTFFKIYDINGAMVYEAFGDNIDNPYININNIPIAYYEYGSCEAAIISTTINYSMPINCSNNSDPDTDMDGVVDSIDACPGFDDNVDTDQDGIADGCDACPDSDDAVDTDQDGIADGCDACPGSDDAVDTDQDGIADGCDACAGFDDSIDTDDDGIADGCDACAGSDDNVDTDDDGIADGCDTCEGSDDNADTDDDGIADGCDKCVSFDDNIDTDNDGIADGCDACQGSDDAVDTDQDGIADGCDACPGSDDTVDTDNDGIADGCDACPGSDDTVDTDQDGIANGCDTCEGFDDNIDTDDDGIADGCDTDTSGQQSYVYPFFDYPQFCDESVRYDCVEVVFVPGCGCWGGIPDDVPEYLFGGILVFYLYEPLNLWSIEIDQNDYCGGDCTFFRVFDVSGEMVYEAFGVDISTPYINVNNIPIGHYEYGSCEAAITSTTLNYLFPVDCNEILESDTDMDGIPDSADACPGFDDNEDTDEDGIADGCDACPDSDDSIDTDQDGIADGCDACPGSDDAVDTDQDGIADGCDTCPGSDDAVDTDQDGVVDGCDDCVPVRELNDTIPNGTYSATEEIIASGEVIDDVTFEAGSSILLDNNFTVNDSVSFEANIGLYENCDTVNNKILFRKF